MYPYNHKKGQKIQSDGHPPIDRAFLAHYQIPGTLLTAASTTACLPFTKLSAAAASILTGLNSPRCPRNVQIDGLNSGQNNVVKVYGTDFAGNAITEEITLNGTTAKEGNLAFQTITKIDLPVEDNLSAKQKTTSAVSAATGAGTATLTLTAACLGASSPYDIAVVFAAGDVASTTTAAARLKAAFNADPVISAHFLADSSTANFTLERKIAENQDATINLVVKAAGTTGLSLGAITKNTVTGVCDEVSVGFANKIGIPYKLTADELVILKLFDNSADSGTVTPDATDLSKNVIALNGAPNGAKNLDLYIVV